MTRVKAHTKPVPSFPFKRPTSDEYAGRVSRWTQTSTTSGYPMPLRDQYDPEWRATLRDCGYPTNVVVLDFETYFDTGYSLDKMSTIEYVMDDRFEVLGCSCLQMLAPFQDYEASTFWWNGEQGVEKMLAHLKLQYGENLERCTVVMQNAAFDGAVLSFRYDIHPPYTIDTLGLARHWDARNKNDLGSLTKRNGLIDKGDTKKFKEWTNRKRFKTPAGKGSKMPTRMPVMASEQQQELGHYANNDTNREWEVFTIYLPRLSDPKVELRAMQHTLDLFWQPFFQVDEEKAADLKEQMLAQLEADIEPTGLTLTQVRGAAWDDHMFQALEVAGADPDYFTKSAKCKRGWKIASAKGDPQREELESHNDPEVRKLMAAKIAAGSWPNHIRRIDRIVAQARAAGGYLPVPLKYCGAHTGRWSGGEKINLQNLGSRSHDLIKAIRELLIAPSGWELFIADASQIEARVLAWFARQEDLMGKFANGEEIYCGFAQRVLGRPVRKPRKEGGIPSIEAWMLWARNSVGKVGILGCGYGMGAKKAVGYAGGTIDLAMSEKLVEQYRSENDKIVQWWKDLEKAFIYTARYKQPCRLPRNLRFDSTDECDVMITLPSGRELKYHHIRLEEGRYGTEISVFNANTNSWGHVWGGHLAENVVQAASRDILWGAVAEVEAAGYHVPHHVHDELIGACKVGEGKKGLAIAEAALRRRPDWAPDLPLDAEGVVTTRYGGH